MTVQTRTLPSYLSTFAHPGISCPQNPTEGLFHPNSKYLAMHTQIMTEVVTEAVKELRSGSRIASREDLVAIINIATSLLSGQEPIFEDRPEVRKVLIETTNRFKGRLMTSLDMPVDAARIDEREKHQNMLKALEAHIPKDLSILSAEEIDFIIAQIHKGLSSEESSCRTRNVVIRKSFFKDFFDSDSMIPYLQENDPSAIPVYQSLMRKLIRFYPPSTTSIYPHIPSFYRDGNLTPQEKALIDTYMEFRLPDFEQIPMLMKIFIQKLLSRLQKKEDPIAIAAFAHMQIIAIHPYEDGNGRVARAVMNWILASAGLPPVAFVFNQEYTQAIQKTRNGSKQIFEDFIRRKVEQNRGKDPAKIGEELANIVEASENARTIQAVWGKIPKQRRRELVADLFDIARFLSATSSTKSTKR